MFTPLNINPPQLFKPLGDTPVYSLTQDLPHEQPADLLLLGCGDARNILYTVYCDAIAGKGRKIDATCCDIEPAVIARNILLFTLILDDNHKEPAWNLYFHLYLDKKAFSVLKTQSKKLALLAQSLEIWHASKYGNVLCICDSKTLAELQATWSRYSTADLPAVEASFTKARELRRKIWGLCAVLGGTSSTSPFTRLSVEDSVRLHDTYWKTGALGDDKKDITALKPNPTFATLASTLHWSTNPLWGFHLAAAYAPIKSEPRKQTEVARKQFEVWCAAFKKSSGHVKLRFFVGEALAFAHSLQTFGHTPNRYRDPWHMDALVLDGNLEGFAPSFDAIDTSNLVTSLGPLNVLVAASPLLKEKDTSVLLTRFATGLEEDRRSLAKGLLGGDLASVSLLLGLFAVEYWSATSASFTFEDDNLRDVIELVEAQKIKDDVRLTCRMVWKRSLFSPGDEVAPRLKIDEQGLARILFDVYLQMFRRDNILGLHSSLGKYSIKNLTYLYYHRGSYAAFLQRVRSTTTGDWTRTCSLLLNKIRCDTTLFNGEGFMDELYAMLHLYGLYTVNAIQPSLSGTRLHTRFRQWKDLPEVLYLTLKVPRLDITGIRQDCRMKNMQAALEVSLGPKLPDTQREFTFGPQQGYAFSVLQAVFGSFVKKGQADQLELHITQDAEAWTGKGDLFLSFCVPTRTVLRCAEGDAVTFQVDTTSLEVFMPGDIPINGLISYETRLDNESAVFFTRHAPNQQGLVTMPQQPLVNTKGQLSATVDPTQPRITVLQSRIDCSAPSTTEALRDKGEVRRVRQTPLEVDVKIGNELHHIRFPAAIRLPPTKTRVARTSCYVEIEATLAKAEDLTKDWTYIAPVLLDGAGLTAWNMPYVSLESLPSMDFTKKRNLDWMTAYSMMLYSKRESRAVVNTLTEQFKLMEGFQTQQPGSRHPFFEQSHITKQASLGFDAKTQLKKSMYLMLTRFSGSKGDKAEIYALDDREDGGIHIIIFISSFRLNAANGTIILDVALLPVLPPLVTKLAPFLQAVSKDKKFLANPIHNAEMKLWKQVLPAYVERCRLWDHKPECEYQKAGQVPVSFAKGEMALCSCGEGKNLPPLPLVENIPGFDVASQFMTRAAISPPYTVQLVEDVRIDIEEKDTEGLPFHLLGL